jgi:hypothetical protein
MAYKESITTDTDTKPIPALCPGNVLLWYVCDVVFTGFFKKKYSQALQNM